jgi:hypothetical protein
MALDKGQRLLKIEVEEVGAVAAGDLEDVAEALGGDEADANPRRSVIALITTVAPWAKNTMSAGRTPPLSSERMTPVSKSGGVVSTFAVRTVPQRPVAASTS